MEESGSIVFEIINTVIQVGFLGVFVAVVVVMHRMVRLVAKHAEGRE